MNSPSWMWPSVPQTPQSETEAQRTRETAYIERNGDERRTFEKELVIAALWDGNLPDLKLEGLPPGTRLDDDKELQWKTSRTALYHNAFIVPSGMADFTADERIEVRCDAGSGRQRWRERAGGDADLYLGEGWGATQWTTGGNRALLAAALLHLPRAVTS